MTKHSKFLLIWIASLGLLASACWPQEPIRVYVTPTHDTSTSVGTTVPTAQIPPTASPTFTVTAQITTAVPTETALQPAGSPTATPLGPVIGPEYTLPPTSTPRPSATPTIGPSPTPPSTDTPAGPQPTALPNLDSSRVGIQLDPTLKQSDWNEAMRRVNEVGFGWLKVQVAWKYLQPNGPDEFGEDLARLQLYLQDAKKQRNLKILVSIAKAPGWARSNQAEDGPPNDPQALARFISLFLTKFGDVTDAVEIWNEPNLSREWQGQPLTGGSYMQYFGPAYNAIRAYSKSIIVVSAGLAPTGTQTGAVNDRTYLQQMYGAGLGHYSDIAVGVHPYSWGNSPDAQCCDASDARGWDDDPHFFFSNNLSDYRKIMQSNGHANNQLWATEFGWATWQKFPGDAPDKWMTYNSECDQANYTLRAIQIGQGLDYMGPMFLWNLNFANETSINNRDERAAYSIVLPPGMPERRLYWMLYDAFRPEINRERC